MVRVTVGAGLLHKSGFGPLVIPHPSIANWLLRRGLPGPLHRDLSFAHEFAHFQTVPLLFIYLPAVFMTARARGLSGLLVDIFLLACVQAAWEIVSEGLVVLQAPATYRMSYAGKARMPRIVFWAVGGLFAVAGWVLLQG